MKVRTASLAIVLAVVSIIFACPLAALRAEDAAVERVTGRLVDKSGQPIDGADIGFGWGGSDSPLMPARWRITNSKGLFSLERDRPDRQKLLFAASHDRSVGSLIWLADQESNADLELVAKPLVQVHGHLTCPELPVPVSSFLVEINTVRASAAPIEGTATLDDLKHWSELSHQIAVPSYKGDRFEFHLPPGKYLLRFNSAHRD